MRREKPWDVGKWVGKVGVHRVLEGLRFLRTKDHHVIVKNQKKQDDRDYNLEDNLTSVE